MSSGDAVVEKRSADKVIVRLDSSYGRQRFEIESHACLSDLSLKIQEKTGLEPQFQIVSFDRLGMEMVPKDQSSMLHDCGIRNGTQLYLRKSETPIQSDAVNLHTFDASCCMRDASSDSRQSGDRSTQAETGQAASSSITDPDMNMVDVECSGDVEMSTSAHVAEEVYGDEMDVACIHAFSGNVLCTVSARPSSTLQMLAIRAQRQLCQERAEDDDDDTCFLFMEQGGQARVLDERLLLKDVIGENGGCLSCVRQPVEAATKALATARRQRIFDSLDVYEKTVLRSLSNVRFGDELAADVYARLKEGRRLTDRVTFTHRVGIKSDSQTDTWEMCCGRAEYRRPDESKFTVAQQIGMYGRVTFVERRGRACGDVALCVGDHVEVWTDLDEFVAFWGAMSERRLAAYFSGILCSRDKLSLSYLQQNAWKISLDGTLTMSDFKEAARPLESWEL